MTDTSLPPADTIPSLPTDAELRHQIVNFDVMDFPSSHKLANSNVKMPLPTKVDALAPAHRAEIMKNLAGYPANMRADKEAELVQAKVAELARDFRIRSGPPSDATPFQKESWDIRREILDLDRRAESILIELAEVTFIDPVTEERTFRHAVGSVKRAALDAELGRIQHHIGLLQGAEGRARLDKAEAATADTIRAKMQERIDAEEVEKRAKDMVREAELNRRAAAKAKFMSPGNLANGGR